MEQIKRTHTCGDLRKCDDGKTVILNGWVHRIREHGGITFINLRDRYGITQVVVDSDASEKLLDTAKALRMEFCIAVEGLVRARPDSMINKDMTTGEIELVAKDIEILSKSDVLPFMIDEVQKDGTPVIPNEDLRLKYRYLDLRTAKMQHNIILRSQVAFATREYLTEKGFLEIETPTFIKSTPEGARDYLVPSRVHPGTFYSLPQSPQLYKQILMVSGFDKYFQIARCYRDEDARGDRQPEFTQIDMEMSFVDEEDVMSTAESLIAHVFKEVKGIDVKLPLPRMKYDDAIAYYGSDKPDLRFDMKINDITSIFTNTEFSVFRNVIESNGIINCLVVKNQASNFSRKDIDKLTDFVKTYKVGGLAWLKYVDGELSGSIAKVVSDSEKQDLMTTLNIEDNDLVLIVADKVNVVKQSLGALRLKLGRDLNLIDDSIYKMLWVVDFPSFEWSDEENRFMACHHPFTCPKDSDVDKLLTDKAHCYSKAYDIVINGYEAGGGSIRIHDQNVQAKMFEALGFTEEQAKEKFGFF